MSGVEMTGVDLSGVEMSNPQCCEECGVNKHVDHPNKAPAGVTSIPGEPLEEMMLDFLGPFQTARSHPYRYILQTQDVFSRFIMFIPCVDAQASTAADAVMERWICTFGMPKRIRSDGGPTLQPRYFGNCASEWGLPTKWDLRNIPRVRLRWKGRIS